MSPVLTPEQRRAVDSNAPRLVVQACAGAGKSSTLIRWAAARPQARVLLLTYNRSAAEQMRSRGPANMRASTTHALAFADVGKRYVHKLREPRTMDVARALGVAPLFARATLDTVRNFLASVQGRPGPEHVGDAARASGLDPDQLADLAGELWRRMKDPADSVLTLSHDGYLKLYQLAGASPRDYTAVLLDEAQDTNPCTAQLVERITARHKVWVGDSHQSIYAFRGAIDALAQIGNAEQARLSVSFRFGAGVAKVATLILQRAARADFEIVGGGADASTQFEINPERPYAYVARTNAQVLDRAVSVVQRKSRLHYVGGEPNFQDVLDVYYLFARQPDRIADPYVRAFGDFLSYETIADQIDDREMKQKAAMVQKYGHDVPALVAQVCAAHTREPDQAQVFLSTAHKAKGREFEQVELSDGFIDLNNPRKDERGQPLPFDPQEVNLLYVAVTRAQRALQLPVELRGWLLAQDWDTEKLAALGSEASVLRAAA